MAQKSESAGIPQRSDCKGEGINPPALTSGKDKVEKHICDPTETKLESNICKKSPVKITTCNENPQEALLQSSEILAKKGSGKISPKMTDDTKKQGQQLKLRSSNLVTKALENISKSSATKQLILGSVSGWTTGFLTMKVGKTAAFAVGGGIILFQVAQHRGLVSMDWDQVKQKVDNTSKKFDARFGEKKPQWISNVKRFSRTNTCFAAGFVGGFLIGLAS